MFRKFREFEKGEFIVVAADTSSGLGDYCAAQFISKTKIDVPLVYHSKTIATEMTNVLYPTLERIFDITGIKPVIAYERNAGGTFEIERLASMNRNGKYTLFKMPTMGQVNQSDPVRYGWDTNTATRPAMLSQLKEAIDNKLLNVYDKITIEEMYSFIVSRTSVNVKAQAEQGCHDDLVMSLAIAWQLYQQCELPSRPINLEDLPKYVVSDNVIGI
jgi:hypothetical protein